MRVLFICMMLLALAAFGCDESNSGDEIQLDGDTETAGEVEASDKENDETVEAEEERDPLIPPRPLDKLGFERPKREASGVAPTSEEVTAFTKKITDFYKETGYFDWVWRTSHGLDKSYDPDMMDYKLWWQDVGMRKEGDTVIFSHHGRAENIADRTMRVFPNAIAGYLQTGNKRMANIAKQYMKGMVALSLGTEFEREDPIVKYIQTRAIFNHNHSYTVDDRKVKIDYTPACVPSAKWNVHIFEIPDNPMYGNIWVSNMRSKDDVPYIYQSMTMATRAYYEAEDPELREAAKLFIEYQRGFCQSIVDNDWRILTKYEDGKTSYMYDIEKASKPEADLGSFVYWKDLFGEDAECNAQLGAALTATGTPLDRGDCGGGLAGDEFEQLTFTTHFFNYENYIHFHTGALVAAQLWRHDDIAKSLMEGLIKRFDKMMYDPKAAHRDDRYYKSGLATWIFYSAAHGYPLTGDEANLIMEWYGRAADWYVKWPHWDPWNSLKDGESLNSEKAPNVDTIEESDGSKKEVAYIRLMEMSYFLEYCASPLRDKEGIQIVDCDAIMEMF